MTGRVVELNHQANTAMSALVRDNLSEGWLLWLARVEAYKHLTITVYIVRRILWLEPKILIVDDELVVIKSAERVLKSEGYNVEGALGGREAIMKIGQENYDLVFTDLKMPEVDGITLIRWIKKTKPSVGIVIITGYPSQDTIKEALELGIIDYVPKPFTPSVLLDVTERAVEWARGRKPEEEKRPEEFPPAMAAELDRVIAQLKTKPGCLIPVLQRAQEIVGYLPPVVQKRIAKGLNIPEAEVHSVVSFYSFLYHEAQR